MQRGNLGLMHILAIGHICYADPKLDSGSLKEGGVTSRDALLATLSVPSHVLPASHNCCGGWFACAGRAEADLAS